MSRFPFLVLLGAWCLAAQPAAAQSTTATPVPPTDTVRLTLPAAEQRFFQNNLAVLAQQYNVTVAQAQAVQARLIDNPTLYVEQDVLRRRIVRPTVRVNEAISVA